MTIRFVDNSRATNLDVSSHLLWVGSVFLLDYECAAVQILVDDEDVGLNAVQSTRGRRQAADSTSWQVIVRLFVDGTKLKLHYCCCCYL